MSRRYNLQRQKNIKQATYFFVGGFFIIFLFLVIGIPILINLSSFLSNIFSPKKVLKKNERFLQQPQLEIPFEATNTAKIAISGFGPINTKVNLFVNNRQANEAQDKNGSFTFPSVTIYQGNNEIYCVAIDEATKKEIKSDVSTIILDNKKPEIFLDNLNDNQEFQLNNQITIKGHLNEDGTVYLNDRFIMLNSDKTFSYDIELQEGDNKLKFRATDKAGNFVEKEITVKFRK